MKLQLGIAAMIVVAVMMVIGPSKAQTCLENANNQLDMNACASKSFQQADAQLNAVFQQILKEYAHDPVFLGKLKIAQQAWVTYRDAELAALFPHSGGRARYGSAFPMCTSSAQESLARSRTAALKRWLDGTRRNKTELFISSRARNRPRGAIILKESCKTSLRIYHLYHSLENQVARRRAELDNGVINAARR